MGGCGRGASMLSMVKSGAGGRSGKAPPNSSAVLSSAGASRGQPPPAPPMPPSPPQAPCGAATLTDRSATLTVTLHSRPPSDTTLYDNFEIFSSNHTVHSH
ncbi:unnamed protein product [Arctia plantaginis]|uniref:Uncharacterized protein n=1 Tax=Arctia plantaginis TaxID=874455 RepID=A0A8S1AR18_ARCPL|nr:unnamed protein product [Arctia plantaginis]